MSNTWFNLRIFWWHFQCSGDYRFGFRIGFNYRHWFWRGLLLPLALYELRPFGWRII